MEYETHLGDCLQVLRGLPANSINSVVTDPPYGIRFMGKSWDGQSVQSVTTHPPPGHDPA